MQVSYMILAQVSPVTHSVGNCVKRVIVIVTSVLFFRTPVSTVNALGKSALLSEFQSSVSTVFIVTMVEHLRGGWKGWQVVDMSIWQELVWLWLECLLILKWKPRKETRKRSRLYVCQGHLWLLWLFYNWGLGLKLVPEILSCCMFSWRHIDAVLSELDWNPDVLATTSM